MGAQKHVLVALICVFGCSLYFFSLLLNLLMGAPESSYHNYQKITTIWIVWSIVLLVEHMGKVASTQYSKPFTKLNISSSML